MGHMVEERAPSHFTRFHVQPSPSTKMVDGAAQESGLPFLLAPEQSREREREREKEREREREREKERHSKQKEERKEGSVHDEFFAMQPTMLAKPATSRVTATKL